MPKTVVETMMDHIDCLVHQLTEITGSCEITYRVLEWMSSLSELDIKTIIADYLAQDAEAARPSFYMEDVVTVAKGGK